MEKEPVLAVVGGLLLAQKTATVVALFLVHRPNRGLRRVLDLVRALALDQDRAHVRVRLVDRIHVQNLVPSRVPAPIHGRNPAPSLDPNLVRAVDPPGRHARLVHRDRDRNPARVQRHVLNPDPVLNHQKLARMTRIECLPFFNNDFLQKVTNKRISFPLSQLEQFHCPIIFAITDFRLHYPVLVSFKR